MNTFLNVVGFLILWFTGLLVIPILSMIISAFVFKVKKIGTGLGIGCLIFIGYLILTGIFLIII